MYMYIDIAGSSVFMNNYHLKKTTVMISPFYQDSQSTLIKDNIIDLPSFSSAN